MQNLTLDEASATPSLSKQVDVTYALYDSPVLSSRFKGVIYSKPPAPPNFISLASEENLVSPRRYAPLPCPPCPPQAAPDLPSVSTDLSILDFPWKWRHNRIWPLYLLGSVML